MPAIKAYKSKGKLIPVDEAKLGKAYRCPWTGNVYATKKAYVKHLRLHREGTIRKQIRAKIRHLKSEELWNQQTFAGVIQWIEMNPDWILDNVIREEWSDRKSRYDEIRPEWWFRITKLRLTRSDCVSNSHNAPHTGVTNWCGEGGNVPRGYPGWHGSIEFKYSHELSGFGSSVFSQSRIHLGSGGGGAKGGRYEVKFFDDDWPGLSKSALFDTIAGKQTAGFNYDREQQKV